MLRRNGLDEVNWDKWGEVGKVIPRWEGKFSIKSNLKTNHIELNTKYTTMVK